MTCLAHEIVIVDHLHEIVIVDHLILRGLNGFTVKLYFYPLMYKTRVNFNPPLTDCLKLVNESKHDDQFGQKTNKTQEPT